MSGFFVANLVLAATTPSLGTASDFAALGTAVTLTDSIVTGNVGSTAAYTNTTSVVNGTQPPASDTAAIAATADFLTAYGAVKDMTCDGSPLTGTLAGVTLTTPGVYCFDAAATLTGVLTLDGPADGVWIFKIGTSGTGALTGTSFSVVMTSGQASNVTWWVKDAATMTDSNFKGTILSGAAITVTRGILTGRALATADVTVTGPNTVTIPTPATLPGTLSAEDFGVFPPNESGVIGYTAGFGLTDATFAGVQSVVMQLYSGTTLLQTNTATPQVGIDVTGIQISSPFDVFGTFNYVTDGYWTNVRGTEYGQNLVPTKVVATVTLANGKVVTAENTNPTGIGPVFIDTDKDSIFDPGEQSFATIQAAVNAASTTVSQTIVVTAGIYDEQVVIDGKSLTLQGVGDTTIIKPSSASKLMSFYTIGTQAGALWNGAKLASIISVSNAGNVIIKDLKVDGESLTSLSAGANYVVGVSYGETGGTVSNVKVVNMNKVLPEAVRTYGMWLDAVTTPVSVEVKNSNINLYNKNGINARGAELTVNIHNNTVTGPTSAITQYTNGIGIVSGANGIIAKNVVTKIYTSGTEYTATGIFTYDTSGVTIEDNTISESLTGIALSGTSSTGGTSSSTVQRNIVFNCDVGIQLEAPNTANNIINYNTIRDNNEEAIYLSESQPWPEFPQYTGYQAGAGNEAHFNNIYANNFGVKNGNPDITFDATNNWWGTASSTEIATKVSNNVDFDPWYTNNEMTTLSDNTVTNASYSSTVDGQADLPNGATEVTLTDTTVMDLSAGLSGDAVTLQSGVEGEAIVLTNSNLAGFSASIPDGTTITGPDGWDGMIQPPMATSTSGNAPAGFSVGNNVISIGSPAGTLVFDKPVTILLAGVTGTVGYRPSGSDTWVQITNTCTAGSYDSPIGAVSPGECAISDSANTKILTYHFTTFGSLVAIPVVIPPQTSGGGGSSANPPPAPTVTIPATPATPATPAVLGATVYNFASDLRLGMTGNAVTELQKRLTSEGVYSGPITGYFGPLTMAGVKAYQAKYGISQVGAVGPLTRAKLNASQVAGASTINLEAIRTQIASLQAQVVVLLQQLLQMLQTQANQ